MPEPRTTGTSRPLDDSELEKIAGGEDDPNNQFQDWSEEDLIAFLEAIW